MLLKSYQILFQKGDAKLSVKGQIIKTVCVAAGTLGVRPRENLVSRQTINTSRLKSR